MDVRSERITQLEFAGLTLASDGRTPIFEGVDFDFSMGGVNWIRGETGSGKSSLLRVLATLQEPSEGRYLVNGEDITQLSFEELGPLRRKIGYGFAEGGLISNRTLRQNLMLPFFYHRTLSAAQAEARVNQYCRHFRLEASSHLRPAQASSGVRKACAVARSLILKPELLLLDQPTAGLDEIDQRTLLDLIRHHRESEGLSQVFIVSDDSRFMGKVFEAFGTSESSQNARVIRIADRRLHAAVAA
jgi:ABC-type transporter Mla maintaining outer membrane lipid asymmetry ATPase subunit MlaF